ncbi:hypothetical protein PUNSTDRAFT_143535 [Punctularia strigosozonata HHB-11173 SS5]|uniref:uncharacterized protein n=1 Tax=Punctularia strigosozonata (strain HHB-11173) TaxID=741275 RepID=UPI0004416D51|nr:uncharacterized protein PUNSTDRAFT_143535 [Punctularia strigosozonata HHB-11173 SS5]EIN08830.1 hypothetical protein PUNSTDRAFT_143535 [Punctularia strigosozonata HHB-11173 SS5]
MSCRRSDRARFIGCHVGAVAIRGCSHGCCPYATTPKGIEENERYSYPSGGSSPTAAISSAPSRPSYTCRNRYRPKYVCLGCRRTWKPAIVEGNEYQIDEWCDSWLVRKEGTAQRISDEVYARRDAISRDAADGYARDRACWERLHSYRADSASFTEKQIAIAREHDPEMWWTSLNVLRCSTCGTNGTRVGPAFRAPKQKDTKGWDRARALLGQGEAFSFCMTPDEEAELTKEAARVQSRLKDESWLAEKERRLVALGLIGILS